VEVSLGGKVHRALITAVEARIGVINMGKYQWGHLVFAVGIGPLL
jgi:hypothetical protein